MRVDVLPACLCPEVPEEVRKAPTYFSGASGYVPRRNWAGYVKKGPVHTWAGWAWQEVL